MFWLEFLRKKTVTFCTISGLKDAVTKKVKITGLSSAFMVHFRVFCFVFLFLCLQNFDFGSTSQRRREAVQEWNKAEVRHRVNGIVCYKKLQTQLSINVFFFCLDSQKLQPQFFIGEKKWIKSSSCCVKSRCFIWFNVFFSLLLQL